MEIPSRTLAGRIASETRKAVAVKFARIALALQPAARARPEVEPVGRNVWIRVRSKYGVVLARDSAPTYAHLRSRPGTVRKHSAHKRRLAYFIARHRKLHLREGSSRRHHERRMHAHRMSRRIDDDEEVKFTAARAVTLVVRSYKVRTMPRAAAADAKRLAGRRVYYAHPEVVRRRNLDSLVLWHAHHALRVARERPAEMYLAPGRKRR